MRADGVGMVFFDYSVTVLMWLSAILQLAVIRDRSLPETRHAEACRWLVAAGVAGLALRLSFVLYDTGDIRLPPFSLASLMLISIGLIGRSLEQIMHQPHQRRVSDQVLS